MLALPKSTVLALGVLAFGPPARADAFMSGGGGSGRGGAGCGGDRGSGGGRGGGVVGPNLVYMSISAAVQFRTCHRVSCTSIVDGQNHSHRHHYHHQERNFMRRGRNGHGRERAGEKGVGDGCGGGIALSAAGRGVGVQSMLDKQAGDNDNRKNNSQHHRHSNNGHQQQQENQQSQQQCSKPQNHHQQQQLRHFMRGGVDFRDRGGRTALFAGVGIKSGQKMRPFQSSRSNGNNNSSSSSSSNNNNKRGGGSGGGGGDDDGGGSSGELSGLSSSLSSSSSSHSFDLDDHRYVAAIVDGVQGFLEAMDQSLSGDLVAVVTYMPYCRSCHHLRHRLRMVAEAYAIAGSGSMFYEINLHANPEVHKMLDIHAVPTILLYSSGQLVDDFTCAGTSGPRVMLRHIEKQAGVVPSLRRAEVNSSQPSPGSPTPGTTTDRPDRPDRPNRRSKMLK